MLVHSGRKKAGVHISTTHHQSAPPADSAALVAELQRLGPGLTELRSAMDAAVVGHADVKHATVLGLLSREHVYLEGPPGVAKTMLAEVVARTTGLRRWFYQLHRDTRLSELIGDAVIVKEPAATGEIIRQQYVRGGILTCELAVLDDISRAPGEALNVLLRVLNERRFTIGSGGGGDGGGDGGDGGAIPLLSAIATGNPAEEDGYYAEPLDPATLDRFALQLRAGGLVEGGAWDDARSVIDLYGGAQTAAVGGEIPAEPAACPALGPALLHDAAALVPRVDMGEPVGRGLLRLLRALRDDHGCTPDAGALLSDRTFLVKAVAVLKAEALLQGRAHCELADMRVLRYMTTFRVPRAVHDDMAAIVQRVIEEQSAEEEEAGGAGGAAAPGPGGDGGDSDEGDAGGATGGGAGGGDGGGDDGGSEEGGGRQHGAESAGDSGGSGGGEETGEGGGEGGGDSLDGSAQGGGNAPVGGAAGGGGAAEQQRQAELRQRQQEQHEAQMRQQSQRRDAGARGDGTELGPRQAQEAIMAKAARHGEEQRLDGGDSAGGPGETAGDDGGRGDKGRKKKRGLAGQGRESYSYVKDKTKNMRPLLQRLRGALERGKVSAVPHPAGLPRGWEPGRGLGGGAFMADGDPVETALWCGAPSPLLPRAQRRVRQGAAGRVAVLRDTSTSMMGLWNAWASALCANVVGMAKQQGLRVGYLEFNSGATKFVDARRAFFTREYAALLERAAAVRCDGLTNYERPLAIALAEFGRKQPRRRPLSPDAARRRRHTDQHILFVTDGQPTSGDRALRTELAAAQAFGVAVHTVYIGYSDCPAVLDRLSEQTGGARFRAYYETATQSVQLVDRADTQPAAAADRGQPWKLAHERERDNMGVVGRVPALFQQYTEQCEQELGGDSDVTYMW
eukprot:g1480.t1